MSFDTLIMQRVTRELNERLSGASAQRITEPARGEIAIEFYSHNGRDTLLFSIESNYARVHLAGKQHRGKKQSDQPSPFCMLLRKYLTGGRAISFSNPPLERIMEIAFSPPDGLPPVRLIAEIMNRRSNLILVDGDNKILGAIKTVGPDKNHKRSVLPGEKYVPVPTQDKLNPHTVSEEELGLSMDDLISAGKNPEQALFGSVEGVSPLTARELLYRAGWNTTAVNKTGYKHLHIELRSLFGKAEKNLLQPSYYPSQQIYAVMPLAHLGEEKPVTFDSVNTLLNQFYGEKIQRDREKTVRDRLKTGVEKRLKSLALREKRQRKELSTSEKAPQYRLYGETLLAYGDQVPKGAETASLPDLYNPEERIVVPLNPAKNAATNARYFFNRYRKAKNGRDKVLKQLARTRNEIEYCRELLYSIESSSGDSLTEIREELVDAGYIKEKKKSQRRRESSPSPLSYKTSSGLTILVGRNNRQNDYITFQAAVRRDTWFHVRLIPGSHVVLKETTFPPSPDDCREAAFLAAYFSKGRENRAVDVDYTEIRHVRRRPGGNPGLVFYENYETITVNPGNEKLKNFFKLS